MNYFCISYIFINQRIKIVKNSIMDINYYIFLNKDRLCTSYCICKTVAYTLNKIKTMEFIIQIIILYSKEILFEHIP